MLFVYPSLCNFKQIESERSLVKTVKIRGCSAPSWSYTVWTLSFLWIA